MKKIILLSLLMSCLKISAQNRQIEFEHGDLASVYAKAKKENKLIFVDAYTAWCGPCKWLAKNVFTNDTVADFFNAKFVNYKMDMEKGEGIEFARKFDVQCYPTLLFVDADGKLVNRQAGAPAPKYLIDYANNSLIPEKTFSYNKAKIEKEGFNENNIMTYIQLFQYNCLDYVTVAKNYIKTVKEENLMNRNNWLVVREVVSDPESREIKHLLANQAKYESKFGKDTVANKLVVVGAHYFNKFIRSEGSYDKAEYEKTKKELIAKKWPKADKIIFDADLQMLRKDLPKYYELAARSYQKYYNDDPNALNSMAWTLYENSTDQGQLKSALNMSKRACELSPGWAHFDTQAAVLFKLGNFKEAEVQAKKAIDTGKKNGDDVKETEELLKKIQAKMNG